MPTGTKTEWAARSAWTVTLAIMAFAACTAPAVAQPAGRRTQARHATVEFLVDRQPDASTRELWMGLRFELDQGWHVYWQNPGDSGGPPFVLWQPAAGVTIDEFEWPTPERIPLGPLMNYGYTNEVVLPFRVRFAKPPAPGLRLGGLVKWLICHDVCIPAQATLSIPLPLPAEDQGSVPTWQKAIAAARARVPKAAPAAWRARVTPAGDEFVLTIDMDRTATPATFFPIEGSQVADAAPQDVKTSGRQLVMRLKKSDQLTSDPAVLRGVVVLASGEAVTVEAPVRPASGRPAGQTPR